MKKSFLINLIGWYGMIAVLAGYFLLSLGYIEAKSLHYIFLNATGAGGIVVIAFHSKDYQSGFLNIAWVLISLFSLYQIYS
ncbi:MAG: hypothetical protein PHT84_00840 [Candidatus Pacebacteria bacterium]|nr:hypothetical protein [Candidatus Paceibacterota bacterium]